MNHTLDLLEFEDHSGIQWSFLFYQGKLLQFGDGDSDESVHAGTLESLPFVTIRKHTTDQPQRFIDLVEQSYDLKPDAMNKKIEKLFVKYATPVTE